MRLVALVLGLAIALVATVAGAADLSVAEIGSFHVGGRAVSLSGLPTRDVVFTAGSAPIKVDPNGDFEAEQMYVQYVKLASPKARDPLLLWHGGGLTGVTWETKPDGKPGWQLFFLRAGHDVYVSDAVERGRASWARYPEILQGEPLFRTKKQAWEDFRIGPVGSYKLNPAERVALPGQLFPVEAFDQFMKQGVPRWSTTDAQIQAAYNQLVQKVCPCVIVTHSQGGNFGFNAALTAPDKVKALISVEPSGAPKPEVAAGGKLKGVPASRRVGRLRRAERAVDALRAGLEELRRRAARGRRCRRLVRPAEDGRGRQHPYADDGQELRPGGGADPEVDG